MNRILIALGLIFTVACGHVEKKADVPPAPVYKTSGAIPVEEFFRNPAVNAFRISPDGKTLAVLKSWKNRMNVFVAPVDNPSVVTQVTFIEDRDIAELGWKGADHIVFSKDSGGDENFHVYVVSAKGGEAKDLTPFKSVRAHIIDDLEDVSPTDILVQHNLRDKEVFDVYRINVVTGESKMLAQNNYKITGWLIDHDGNPRGGAADDGVNHIFYFEKEKGKPYTALLKTDFRNTFEPVAFTADNKNIFVATNLGTNLAELVEIDPSLPASKFIVNRIFKHPKYDLEDASYSKVKRKIGNVQVTTDRRETYFLDADDQKDWDELRSHYPQAGLALASASRDERYWVVKTLMDVSRGSYLVYDRANHKVTALGELSPWLPADLMSPMKTIHYQTRDGLTIEGYLTVPRGQEAHNLPVVVNPHGGPWYRDEWRFNPEVQLLASRGYAVLQMNFRGSTGYGRKFWEASFKQWGKKMQNDVTDGVQWLSKEGVADSKRICIYGASYGGYSTLAGITSTPDLYACAVDYVGVANLFTFMNTIPPYWKPFMEMMYSMVGDPKKDKTLLASTSPVFHADKIKAPLFIAQGANDPRVNKNESDQMVEALHKRGVDVEYMVKDNEGHGFHNEENRFDFYRAMDKFLAKHLGGKE